MFSDRSALQLRARGLYEGRSTISAERSTIFVQDSGSTRDEDGRLLSPKFNRPFVDSLEALTPDFLEKLQELAKEPRAKKRMDRPEIEDVIIQFCSDHYITIKSFAKIMNRGERTLRQDYLSKLCKEQGVRRAFQDTPDHEQQAYTKA
ncbi:MAG: ATP-dependent DNA helicase RecG [Paracoccaceae bacterium]|jgi:ATP-dependent DNA helicase RecG